MAACPPSLACQVMRSIRCTLRDLPKGFATFQDPALEVEGSRWQDLELFSLEGYAGVPGGHAAVRDVLRREKLAMAVCHIAHIYDGRPYGGFVREMHSGKPFRDVDICFDTCRNISSFKHHLVCLLHRLLGDARHAFELLLVAKIHNSMPRQERSTRAYTFTVHRHALTWRNVEVGLDLTHMRHFRHCARVPATLGSRLQWRPRGGVTLMVHVGTQWREDDCIDVEEVLTLLGVGKDIPCFPTHQEWSELKHADGRDQMQRYYDQKHRQLKKRGYVFLPARGVTLARWRKAQQEHLSIINLISESDSESDSDNEASA